ncbi:MAG: nucleotidyltransferase [Eubacteriales bacterium]|nr:nucleotidyltransferase [Eubacteriales bacterium]
MRKPVLVIMAAGIGSRYGGCKQIDPMDAYGNLLIDFSIYDALRAGFEDVVFLIKHEIEADFREVIGDRIARRTNVSYAFQQLDALPAGVAIPEGRVKPFGTTHAILCAADAIDGRRFAAINADDYYGPTAYRLIFDYLCAPHGADEHALVGYPLPNTLTKNGTVTRGVCQVKDGYLSSIVERFKIEGNDKGCVYLDTGTPIPVPADAVASMNFWGFQPAILDFFRESFDRRIQTELAGNPLKFEALLPTDVQACISEGKGTVKVLPTVDKWFGVTYPEDKPSVMASIAALKQKGVYPEKLWES